MQNELKEFTKHTVESLGYQKDILENRHFATSCSDEISLLTQIAKTEFQVEPETGTPEELFGNEMARFKTTISFGEQEVGFAVGRNKKESKLFACKHILLAMVPNLYKEWLNAHQPSHHLM